MHGVRKDFGTHVMKRIKIRGIWDVQGNLDQDKGTDKVELEDRSIDRKNLQSEVQEKLSASNSALRKSIITGNWVVFAKGRSHRPKRPSMVVRGKRCRSKTFSWPTAPFVRVTSTAHRQACSNILRPMANRGVCALFQMPFQPWGSMIKVWKCSKSCGGKDILSMSKFLLRAS